jgi:hypothetical protein
MEMPPERMRFLALNNSKGARAARAARGLEVHGAQFSRHEEMIKDDVFAGLYQLFFFLFKFKSKFKFTSFCSFFLLFFSFCFLFAGWRLFLLLCCGPGQAGVYAPGAGTNLC